MRLLIADSDPTLADVYRSFFSRAGYDVEVAADGVDCLERTRQFLPDALVLEYELPWGGGDGVLANLREEYPAKPMGVVLITRDSSVRDVFDEWAPPVVDCLVKPFRLRELLEIAQSITQDSTAEDTGIAFEERPVRLD